MFDQAHGPVDHRIFAGVTRYANRLATPCLVLSSFYSNFVTVYIPLFEFFSCLRIFLVLIFSYKLKRSCLYNAAIRAVSFYPKP